MTVAEWIVFLQRPEFPAFNRAMLENPDDDLPRLVFADWMDENCPDTAVNTAVRESITNPIPRPKWPGKFEHRRTHILFMRGRVLVGINQVSLVPRHRAPRKLFEAIWLSGWVESARFGQLGQEGLTRWFEDPQMEWVREVALSCFDLSSESLPTLLANPRLNRVISLVINCWGWAIDWLRTLADSPVLNRLTTLSIIATRLTLEDIRALSASDCLVGLKKLNFKDCCMSDEGATILANSPSLMNLDQLVFRDRDITPAGAAALANSPYLCEAIRTQWRRE